MVNVDTNDGVKVLHIGNKRTALKLCKYIASVAQYDKIDDAQRFRVYYDNEADITAVEAVNFRLLWVNNMHSLEDIAKHIKDYTVMTFESLKALVYNMN